MSGGLGRIQKTDPRDSGHQMVDVLRARGVPVEQPVGLPNAYYYHTSRRMPFNQYDTPRCVAFASRGVLDSGLVVNMGGPDPATIYTEAQKRDEIPGENYDGTTARGAMEYLKERGYIERYVWCWDIVAMSAWLRSKQGPVLLGINWYASFDDPPKDSILRLPKTSWIRGGHEVYATGRNESRGLTRCINSWGKVYGDNGRFWIPDEVLDRLMREDGDVVTPTELKVAA